MGERAQYVRRTAAGGNSDQRVAGGETAVHKILPALLRIVLRALDGMTKRSITAGDDALHEFGRGVEGGRTLGSVKHAQAAGGSGANVKQPAACFEARDGGFDGEGDVWEFAL